MLFNKQTIEQMRDEMNESLNHISQKYDVNFKIGRISYGLDHFSAQIDCYVGDVEESRQREFEKLCATYGLKKTDYNARFSYQGQIYKIIGFKPTARKYPYVCENVITGERIRFTSNMMRNLLNSRIENIV